MSSSMKAAIHLRPYYLATSEIYKNTKFEEIESLFNITQKLVMEHSEEILHAECLKYSSQSLHVRWRHIVVWACLSKRPCASYSLSLSQCTWACRSHSRSPLHEEFMNALESLAVTRSEWNSITQPWPFGSSCKYIPHVGCWNDFQRIVPSNSRLASLPEVSFFFLVTRET